MVTVYRVQDVTGRGPWRPGWSATWIEADAPAGHLTETVLDLLPVETIASLPKAYHYGCACRSLAGLLDWFTPIERHRLEAARYYPVRLVADAVLAESPRQVLIARRRPLGDGATRLRWDRG